MTDSDQNLVQDDEKTPEEASAARDEYYADDVQADAVAENDLNPDTLEENDDTEVTSGEMKIGDLDDDAMVGQGSEESYDEEATPAGDNVSDQ
jgi:hypothetical protein